jgi:hypothetical protein
MSIASPTPASSAASGHSSRTELSERIETSRAGPSSTLSTLAEAAVDGVSATVSFSGKALHALEWAGEMAVDGAEGLALGAWHGAQALASDVEHAGEAVADAVEAGVREVVATARSAASELGHYAAVGMHATGEAVSDVASGGVMAASAVGKTVMALV